VEQALHHDFLPACFGEDKVDDAIRQPSSLPVKKAGITIPNPMTSAKLNWTSSTIICSHLVAAIQGRVEFRSADHQQIQNSGIAERKKRQLELSSKSLATVLRAQPDGRRHTI
jgi:hypothetical protein